MFPAAGNCKAPGRAHPLYGAAARSSSTPRRSSNAMARSWIRSSKLRRLAVTLHSARGAQSERRLSRSARSGPRPQRAPGQGLRATGRARSARSPARAGGRWGSRRIVERHRRQELVAVREAADLVEQLRVDPELITPRTQQPMQRRVIPCYAKNAQSPDVEHAPALRCSLRAVNHFCGICSYWRYTTNHQFLGGRKATSRHAICIGCEQTEREVCATV